MNIPLTVASGGDAAIVENDGDHVTLHSSVPSPPGSTLALLHESLAIQVKVRGCKRLTEAEEALESVFQLVGLIACGIIETVQNSLQDICQFVYAVLQKLIQLGFAFANQTLGINPEL